MLELQLSPVEFAESIGIQRSGLSHIFSGRNKPSLEFILKLNQTYPKLSLEWLLTGQKPIWVETINPIDHNAIKNVEPPTLPLPDLFSESVNSVSNPSFETENDLVTNVKNNPLRIDPKIDYILLVYADMTFEKISYRS